MDELAEASGITASRRTPGAFWAVNDSEQPVIYALDAKGVVTGRVRVTGATVEDWEAIAVGPCRSGTCLYVGDIGDNNGTRKQITIYRVPEPAIGDDMTATAEVFHATYPDGPQDAESLVLTSDGSLYIVTKGEKGRRGAVSLPARAACGLDDATATSRQAARSWQVAEQRAHHRCRSVTTRRLDRAAHQSCGDLPSHEGTDGRELAPGACRGPGRSRRATG
jgi:hypothetical protein